MNYKFYWPKITCQIEQCCRVLHPMILSNEMLEVVDEVLSFG